ncbi:MAG: uncharacterized protein JWS12_779 [Candidatus Saccharibacteria bacterium]|nr:uncharacterized protein [Candidatus Saccharibacteria bacterium]
MNQEYWHRQSQDKPLFGDLLWSRPESRQMAGKLLVIGGNLHGFAAPAEAYTYATEAGIGVAKVLLPDALRKTVGRVLENGEYASSTPSGSFSKQALAQWLDFSGWADGVLVAGELGRNSETAILLEQFLAKSGAAVVLSRDAVDYLYTSPQDVLNRQNTALVLSLSQLQKLVKAAGFPKAVTFSMDVLQLVELLHDFSQQYPVKIITEHQGQSIVADSGQVSTTPQALDIWRTKVAAYASVWWLQNPSQSFEALTTAVSEASGDR